MAKQGFKSSTNVVLQPRNMSGQAQPAGVSESAEFDNIHEISRYCWKFTNESWYHIVAMEPHYYCNTINLCGYYNIMRFWALFKNNVTINYAIFIAWKIFFTIINLNSLTAKCCHVQQHVSEWQLSACRWRQYRLSVYTVLSVLGLVVIALSVFMTQLRWLLSWLIPMSLQWVESSSTTWGVPLFLTRKTRNNTGIVS